jgi:hypothetical protein
MSTTTKERLDSLLGITEGKTIDDFLDNISVENNSAQNAIEAIDKEIKSNIKKIDKRIAPLKNQKLEIPKTTISVKKSEEKTSSSPVSLMDLKNLETNFSEISNLVEITKSIITHLYNNVVSTDLIDTELVNATATLIEIAHRNIKEYIDLYKDRMRFYDKVRLEYIQTENKKELIRLKHDLEMERIQKEGGPMEVHPENLVTFSQEDIIKSLAEAEKKN